MSFRFLCISLQNRDKVWFFTETKFGSSPELISHLFWLCDIVGDFLQDVFTLVCSTGLGFTPTREQFLFGYFELPFNDPKNYLCLIIKRFIWISKFNSGELSIVRFKTYLKSVLSDLQVLYDLKNKPNYFNVWNVLFSIL